MSLRTLSILIVLVILSVFVHAQVTVNTSGKGFTKQALNDAKINLNELNKHKPFKVLISLSVFQLKSKKIGIKPSATVQMNVPLQTVVTNFTKAYDELIVEQELNQLQLKADIKAKSLLNSLSNKNNSLIINIVIGNSIEGYGDSAKIKSFLRFSLFNGPNVPESIKTVLTHHFDSTTPDNLDFNDKTFKKNDAFIRELVNTLFTQLAPVFITYMEKGHKNFDDNNRELCEGNKSFQTQPVSGIPWFCIPSTGTFTPLKIETIGWGSSSPLKFRLSNATNFKLKSTTLDSDSLLWISCNVKNKETSIIPVVDGLDIETQKINVVAYEKIVKEIAVVVIEEDNDDIQVINEGIKNLSPSAICIRSGPNKFLDTWTRGDDKATYDAISGDSVILAGLDGISDSYAVNENIVPDSMNIIEFTKQLNEFYNPIMVEWKVHPKLYRKKINYDLNRDGMFEIDTFTPKPTGGYTRNKSQEEEIAFTEGKKNITSQHYLFITDRRVEGFDLLGRTTGGRIATGGWPASFLFTNGIRAAVVPIAFDNMMITTAGHELGHVGFNLLDYYADQLKDSKNLMARWALTLTEANLRKYQWDVIHGLATP